MKALLWKEICLAASPLSYLFIAFALMTLIPGYPILCGAFFITLGIFQSYQTAREANDIVYSSLLPVAKTAVVKGKFAFAVMIEMAGFAIMVFMTALRMTVLAGSPVYRTNALMNANPFFLGLALVIFGLFNLIFIGGFFREAYGFARHFVPYIIAAFAVIGLGEALHQFPGMAALNAFGFEHALLQGSLFLCGAALYAGLTAVSYRKACSDFEKLDL